MGSDSIVKPKSVHSMLIFVDIQIHIPSFLFFSLYRSQSALIQHIVYFRARLNHKAILKFLITKNAKPASKLSILH